LEFSNNLSPHGTGLPLAPGIKKEIQSKIEFRQLVFVNGKIQTTSEDNAISVLIKPHKIYGKIKNAREKNLACLPGERR
jgi:hypothetical protein